MFRSLKHQLLGTLIFISIDWFGIADFLYDFAAYPIYCTAAAIIGNVLMITYLFALYMFFLLRVHRTVAGTVYAISSRTIFSILVISVSSYITLIVLVFLLQRGESITIEFAWTGSSSDAQSIVICDGEFSVHLDRRLRILLQCIIVGGNLFFGLLFHWTLKKVMHGMTSNNEESEGVWSRVTAKSLINLYAVIKKQTILVLLATMSTVIFWSIANVATFYGFNLQILLYIDVWINCLCLWLMNAWNDRYYRKYCVCGWLLGVTLFRCMKNEEMEKISALKRNQSRIELSAKRVVVSAPSD